MRLEQMVASILIAGLSIGLGACGGGGGGGEDPTLESDPTSIEAVGVIAVASQSDDGFVSFNEFHNDTWDGYKVRTSGYIRVGRFGAEEDRGFVSFDVGALAGAQVKRAMLRLTVQYDRYEAFQTFKQQGMIVEYLAIGNSISNSDWGKYVHEDDILDRHHRAGEDDRTIELDVTDGVRRAIAAEDGSPRASFRLRFPDARFSTGLHFVAFYDQAYGTSKGPTLIIEQ